VRIVQHPQLGLELGFVKDVAQEWKVGSDLRRLGDGEVVAQLELEDGSEISPGFKCPSLKANRRAHNRHQCRETTVLSCHRCLIDTGVEKMNI
jgi:hypothetical protein